MESKTQAIVIRSEDFKDGGRKLTLFSLEKGLIYAKIMGVSKPKAKLAFAGQPFCFGEYVLIEKYGYTVLNCTSIENFYDLTLDFDKFIAGSGILEILNYVVRRDEPNTELFVLTLKALKMLNYTKATPLYIFIKFLLESLKISGFGLKLNCCIKCGNTMAAKERISFSMGGRVCVLCADSESVPISKGELAILTTINNTELEKLDGLHFASLDNVCEVSKLLIKYFYDKTGENLSGILTYL